MAFIHEDFLLHSETSRRLYHGYAEPEPILDYHCHLPPADIACNRRFANLFEIWLEGDHYKWRAMRANGVAELFCTGRAEPYEKFLAWARTVPFTLRNPLYHWTHLELQRYFGIDDLLNEESAPRVWERANAGLATDHLRAQSILGRFHVQAVCTTDDPTDDLEAHRELAASKLETRVYPAFRPDRALKIGDPTAFKAWTGRLAKASNTGISKFADLLTALRRRHDAFHAVGCRLSDHGLDHCYSEPCSERTAAAIFSKVRAGRAPSGEEQAKFASFMMLFFGHLDSARGWTKQLHLGAWRNANTRRMSQIGADTGWDSIGDYPQVAALSGYLDRLDSEGALPKTIIYNVNPSDNYAFATLIGNFQDGKVAGKLQFGSGWWFLDQKEGIELQLNALSNGGLLSRFIGMLTDSRSFMSYPRHEYFRRVLCSMLGRDMENGELPNDEKLVGGMVRRICYANCRDYLGLEVGEKTPASAAPRNR